ncbi:hypothetical protein ZPR_1477 [Zunongwangia profunda SM-A87]|uniref:Uncharacterized protein n=1 Tax=Zunongwangia profunda (strain DSM 18752 / CCTCC AB 206139 / SM-A87) TaxID=655815 RepID=D5BKD2_ZUNPS|nr:hypothetical protein ZPR_1477 [Zunongwangia profunda SM-A87]
MGALIQLLLFWLPIIFFYLPMDFEIELKRRRYCSASISTELIS